MHRGGVGWAGTPVVLRLDGLVKTDGESFVRSIAGGVKDAVAVIPLVPGRVPQALDKCRYPAIGTEISIMEKASLIQELGGSPVAREKAPKSIFPAQPVLVLPGLLEGRVRAETLRLSMRVPLVEAVDDGGSDFRVGAGLVESTP